ncbi:MAG TPA: alpha/beta hydrolase [Lacipirellulaceae bacterium]|nr:alpha/beta hydrolase [Lacipirellulaceae bacterium]
MNRRQFCATIWGALGAGQLRTSADARAAAPNLTAPSWMDFMNKTAGGKQFWADVCFFHDWRIQRNALTGHHRLLDGANHRHASGTYETCRETLTEIRRRDNLAPMQGKAVVILHGLFRTRSAMARLRAAIAQAGDYSVFCMGYPTTRGSVADHARSLDSCVRSLEGISEINFVAHSLGNLVVRHWLKDFADGGAALPEGQSFGRMVMLAPPNFQPQLATKLLRTQFASFIAGAAAEQLATGWEDLESRLTTPPFEFGVLAGGKGDGRGYNPLIPGDDDGVITVESTRLPGARDFRRLSVLHSFFMNDQKVHELAARFLAHGYFESEETRDPIESR